MGNIFSKKALINCWRSIKWDEREAILNKLLNYSPGYRQIPEVNILLMGLVGSGKSSFFDSVDSSLKGRISSRELCMDAQGAETHVTHRFRILKPGSRNETQVRFNICDTAGIDQLSELEREQSGYILDGHVSHNFEVVTRGDMIHVLTQCGQQQQRLIEILKLFMPTEFIDREGFIESPTIAQKMHIVAFVIDGSKINHAAKQISQSMADVTEFIKATDMGIAILISHIDLICPAVKHDVRNAYTSKAVREVVDKVHRLTGLPLQLIFLVQNYTSEMEVIPDVDVLNLTALQKILDFGDDHFDTLINDSVI